MASVDVLDEPMVVNGVVPVWTYKPPLGSDESLRNAASVVSCDPNKLRLDEDFKTFQITFMSSDDGGETLRAEDVLSFDFTKQTISLKNKDISIPSSSIHFVHPGSSASSSHMMMMSYDDDGKMKVLHFVTLEGELQLLLIVNAFRRLMFEFLKPLFDSNESAVKVIDNRAPSYVGEIQFDIKSKTKTEGMSGELQTTVRYITVMQWSCMCLYQYQFSCDPSYVLNFWDSPDYSVVEKVVMYNDTKTVRIETSDTSFEIHNANEQCPRFLEAIRKMRPKPKETSTDPKKLIQYLSGKRSYRSTERELHGSSRVNGDTTSSIGLYKQEDDRDVQIRSFQDDMNVALTKFQDNEQIQMPWIVAETEIKDLINSGFVPETDIASGGLDPNSMDHFLQCIREIEDHLTKQQYEMALSRLQGTRIIFSESSLPDMRSMFREDDVILMKKIYYRSFL